MKKFLLVALAVGLAACASKPEIKVNKTGPQTVQTKSRSEPIFYNGKTYQLDYSYLEGQGAFDMRVSGMGPKQQKDAVAVATSSLRYFACPDGQTGKLQGQPAYDSGLWKMQARCARG
jgi:hypothetical protein